MSIPIIWMLLLTQEPVRSLGEFLNANAAAVFFAAVIVPKARM